jgi:hypothetical protein
LFILVKSIGGAGSGGGVGRGQALINKDEIKI